MIYRCKVDSGTPDVEQCLHHPSPQVRQSAFETIAMAWGLHNYEETVFRFLQDPDPDCRRQGIECRKPYGKPLDDLRILKAYAGIVANKKEETELRTTAYGSLLTACGYTLDYDYWREVEDFLDNGGAFEQAPWVDWKLVEFFTADENQRGTFQTGLSFSGEDSDWLEWEDQHGRVFHSVEVVVRGVMIPAHQLAHLRLPSYQMTITFS